MDERRTSPRHRVLKPGTIEFHGGAIDCTVRNLSAAGAALDVTSPVGIPAHFTLFTDGSHFPCHVMSSHLAPGKTDRRRVRLSADQHGGNVMPWQRHPFGD